MFADRREGFVWCDLCVPAEVQLLAGEFKRATAKRRVELLTLGGPRFAALNTPPSVDAVGVPQRVVLALRCRECGAVQP